MAAPPSAPLNSIGAEFKWSVAITSRPEELEAKREGAEINQVPPQGLACVYTLNPSWNKAPPGQIIHPRQMEFISLMYIVFSLWSRVNSRKQSLPGWATG